MTLTGQTQPNHCSKPGGVSWLFSPPQFGGETELPLRSVFAPLRELCIDFGYVEMCTVGGAFHKTVGSGFSHRLSKFATLSRTEKQVPLPTNGNFRQGRKRERRMAIRSILCAVGIFAAAGMQIGTAEAQRLCYTLGTPPLCGFHVCPSGWSERTFTSGCATGFRRTCCEPMGFVSQAEKRAKSHLVDRAMKRRAERLAAARAARRQLRSRGGRIRRD